MLPVPLSLTCFTLPLVIPSPVENFQFSMPVPQWMLASTDEENVPLYGTQNQTEWTIVKHHVTLQCLLSHSCCWSTCQPLWLTTTWCWVCVSQKVGFVCSNILPSFLLQSLILSEWALRLKQWKKYSSISLITSNRLFHVKHSYIHLSL